MARTDSTYSKSVSIRKSNSNVASVALSKTPFVDSTKLGANKIATRSQSICKSNGAGSTLRSKNYPEDDGTSFKSAKERHKKRGRKKLFTYFNQNYLTKESKKMSTKFDSSMMIYRSNGLFKDPLAYCFPTKQEFIVCITKNGEKVNNKTFCDLSPELQVNVLKQSPSMKNLCIYCGTDDDGSWGCCTRCNRWFHCNINCNDVKMNTIEKDNTYKC